MKYLKTYESYKEPEPGDPVVGDYVILKNINGINARNKNTIFKIIEDISSDLATFRTYIILHRGQEHTIWDSEILKHSKRKKDLEIYLDTIKYNL